LLNLYRNLLRLRRSHAALECGDVYGVKPSSEGNQNVLAYRRTDGAERIQVLLNLTGDAQTVSCPPGHLMLSTHSGREDALLSGNVTLQPGEGIMMMLDDHAVQNVPLSRKT
jgi:alpha-glucosidase